MTGKKSTKRALLLSGLALLMCFSMLIGSTYAWFTDSVTSGKNKIVSGNLDVELEYYNGETKAWEKVSENTNVFKEDTLWEPGHTEVVSLKISNLGTLALKYALNINVAKEIESVNVAGETLRLSNYIKYDVIEEDKETLYTDRKTARDEAEKDTGFDATFLNTQYYNKTGVLYSANNIPTDPADAVSEQYITLVVYMPEEIENEANYRTGEAVPEILLGINLLATQLSYEEDSFGSDYDNQSQHNYLPKATVINTTVKDTEMVVVDLINSGTNLETKTLDAAYEFRTLDSADTALYNDYSDWFVDYYVSIDEPVVDGVMLAGTYPGYPWIGIKVPAGDYTQAVGLLGMFSSGNVSNWTYADIVTGVNVFKCGVANTALANSGATMTVQLCLINPEDATDLIVISETKHTFATNVSDATQLEDALEFGGKVVIEEDIAVDNTIEVNQETTIDLNGKTLDVKAIKVSKDMTIVDSGEVTGSPTLYQDPATIIVNNGATVTLEDVDVSTTNWGSYGEYENGTSGGEMFAIYIVDGNVVMNGGDLIVKEPEKQATYGSAYGVIIEGGTFTMNGGSIVAAEGMANPFAIGATVKDADDECTINLNGVTIKTKYMISLVGAGKCTVNLKDTDWDAKWTYKRYFSGTYTLNQE